MQSERRTGRLTHMTHSCTDHLKGGKMLISTLCLLVHSCCQRPPSKPFSSSLSVIHEAEVSFRPYVLVEAWLQSHTNTLIFMSLCSHCVHMLSLVLCCCSAAHRLALSPRPRDKAEAVTPPTGLPSINYAPLLYTHTQTHNGPPQSQSYCCWDPLNGP